MFLFCAPLIIGQYITGVDIGGGITKNGYSWNSPYSRPDFRNEPSLTLGIFYRERKDQALNIGFRLDYYYSAFSIKLNCSSKAQSSYRDIRFQSGYINFYFLPSFVMGQKIKFLITFGPYLGVLVHSHKKGSGEYSGPYQPYYPWIHFEYDLDGSANAELLSVAFGGKVEIGIQVPVDERISFFASTGYKIGKNIVQGGALCSGSVKIYPQNIDFSIGVGYSILNSNFVDFLNKFAD
jgi:hypothetical protein